ncbi:hypothetical protein [Rhizobium sp. 18055]|uniref:hypothetical protein n=1 Tax=Rhizobium sp. 18055 TaxID=2681403 RepID=UPI001358A854|nr:hypothetical protein [Rhizobium sp. 18055]
MHIGSLDHLADARELGGIKLSVSAKVVVCHSRHRNVLIGKEMMKSRLETAVANVPYGRG